MNHSTLEEKEINQMYKIIKHKNNKLNIKNINNITSNIINEMYTNNKVNIYSKKKVAIGTLNKLFLNEIDSENNCKIKEIKDTKEKINNMHSEIDKLINKYDYIKKEKNNRCSNCIIL
jgi:hypothetical protein